MSESCKGLFESSFYNDEFFQQVTRMMIMMNCFCSMADQGKAFSLIPAGTIVRDLKQREFEPVHNLNSGFDE